MGRQRDPNRDKAKEIYKASGGEIRLTDIASQLNVSEGTVRGWKAKDKWEDLLAGGRDETERSDEEATERNDVEEDGARDELFLQAVQIVVEAQQASVSLLQRRLRTGYTRAARLIDAMEHAGYVGPYEGSSPRKVLIKELSPVLLMRMDVKKKQPPMEQNVPKPPMERSENKERYKTIRNAPKEEENPLWYELEDQVEHDELTDRQRIFCLYYVKTFNATQSAIKAGYAAKSAHVEGSRLLANAKVSAEVRRLKGSVTSALFVDAMDVLNKYLKIAFTDITDFLTFGQREVPVMTMFGPMYEGEGDDKKPVTKVINFVDFKESNEIDGTLITEVKQGKDGVSIKLADKMKALEKLEQYFDLLPDKFKRKIEEERLAMDRERLELDKAKAEGGGDSEDELIEDWVSGVVGDEEEGLAGDEEETPGVQDKDS